MRRIALSTALAAILALGFGVAPAHAQYDNNRALYDRIDRLERDLQVMQQNVSRGGGGSTVIRSPAAGGGTTYSGAEPAPMPSGMAARLDDRVDMMEDQIRQLTGKIEEANFKAQQALKQMERLQADIDLRFKDLQAGQGAAAQPQQPAIAMPGPGAAPTLTPPKSLGGNAADGTGPAPGPQVLGAMPEKDLKKALQQQPAAPKDAQGMYDEAFAAAQRGDYANAERGFQAFLDANPKHQLAGNASYWMGDIAYMKKDYGTAASTFLEAYKKYPKHPKLPDMMYKAGSAFGQMGKKKEACTAFGYLFKEHPDMPDRVKRAATAEKQKYECK
ncbi:MAG TPA: tol-pal system protein YbgF [Candidatus Omnitrophota bacterium]|nr:tol-pal system protein YbgF [Candidatus Omnitrophota bacterium]